MKKDKYDGEKHRTGDNVEIRHKHSDARDHIQSTGKNLVTKHDDQLQRITENSPNVIFEFERNKDKPIGFTYVSRVCEEILELKPADLIKDSQKFFDLIHPEDRESYSEIQNSNAKDPKPFNWTGRILTAKTHTEKWVKLSARPHQLKNGIVIWNGIIDDSTQERRSQEELKEAKLTAEEALHAKQDFLATMSHEIRTPLNAIYGITELLMQDEQTKGHEYLDILKFSTDNLRSLINNILDFSKLKSGKYRLLQQKIKIKMLLGHLEKAHSYQASKNGDKFTLDVDEGVPEQIIGDEIVLSQILNNLLGNAVKFTENGEVRLNVKVAAEKGNLVELLFTVQDTGSGIQADQIEKIFGRFEQSDQGYKKKGGTGLGLTITRMLLELCHSQIKVESQEGKGTKFYFTLWFEKTGMLTDDEDQRDGKIVDFKTPIKILIVEDVDENRMLLKKYLSKYPYVETYEAVNGDQALSIAGQNDFDLILMDIRMPVMGGEESMQKIRLLPGKSFDELPIIALTADTYGVDKNSGFTDVITKPFKFNYLLQMIEKHCKE